jgi:hypothetical protein
MLMTVTEFEELDTAQQAGILYRDGVYVGKRKKSGHVVLLFQLEHFYAEVIYSKYRHFISSIRCTNSISILDPYLEQIEVELAG